MDQDINDTYQLLAYADDVKLTSNDVRAIERNTNVLLSTRKNLVKKRTLICGLQPPRETILINYTIATDWWLTGQWDNVISISIH